MIVANNLIDMYKDNELRRIKKYSDLWSLYYGFGYKEFLKLSKDKINDNIKLNYAKLIVNKGISFLFGDDIDFELVYSEEISDEKRKQDKQYLDDVFRINNKQTFLLEIAQNGGVTGTVFIKVIEGDNNNHRIVNLDPSYVKVYTSPHDIKDITKFVIQFPTIDENDQLINIKQEIVRNNESWLIREVRVNEITKQKEVLDEILWNYNLPPIMMCQNLLDSNSIYGISDIEDDIISVNNSLNLMISNLNRIIRFHAHPKTIAKGITEDQIEIGIDDILLIYSPDGDMKNLEMQSDLSSSIEVYKLIKKSLHELSQIPEIALGNTGQLSDASGVALEILYQQLIEKTKMKRILYGDLLKKLCITLLLINGIEVSDIIITWQNMLPVDQQGLRNSLKIDREFGVSDKTIQEKLGYDYESEIEKSKKREISR